MKGKGIIVFGILLLSHITLAAQTWAEFFKQNKTQRKYLIEQIAALRVYADFARKGYGIVKEGTQMIGDLKRGDFNLHDAHFKSLRVVNPTIKKADQVSAIIEMHQAMAKSRAGTFQKVQATKMINATELKLIQQLYANLAAESGKDLEALELLIKDGELELSDDQRISRIDKLYKAMLEKYGFQLQLDRKIIALSESRISAANSLKILKGLYGF